MKLWDDIEPTAEQRALYAGWLVDRPPHVRAVAERFDPWTVYRLKTTGQACRIIGCDEGAVSCGQRREDVPVDRVTVRALCCHPGLPWELAGRQVFGLDPDDFELWPDDEPHESEMTVEIGAPIYVDATVCRRCSDCPGQDHHWLDGSIDPDDAERVAEFRDAHPGVAITEELLLAHEECKHCPAVRPWEDPFESEEEGEDES